MSFVTLLDYTGIIVFVITGALVAARNENDIISFVILGAVTGIGGGTLRDMMLGQTPVFGFASPYTFISALRRRL